MGRFESPHDPTVLLVIAREVLNAADPERPESVSQRRYDETRVAIGHGATPRADKLASRWRVSWATFREHALNASDPGQALAISGKQQVRRVLTRAEAVSAVARVAASLRVDRMQPHDYEVGRRALNARAAARHKHGAHLTPLPSGGNIARAFKWHEIAAEAGIVTSREARPVLARWQAVVAFVEHYGFQPRGEEVRWLGRHHGIQLVIHTAEPHRQAITTAQEHFNQLGRWFPPTRYGFKPPEGWESYGDDSEALAALAEQHPRQRTSKEGWTLDELRVVFSRAFDAIGPGERLTVERYRGLPKDDGFPSVKTIARCAKTHGLTFHGLANEEAARRAATGRRSQHPAQPDGPAFTA